MIQQYNGVLFCLMCTAGDEPNIRQHWDISLHREFQAFLPLSLFGGPLQGSCVSFCCVYYDILLHSAYSGEESLMFRLAVSSQKMHSAPHNLFHTMAKCFSICPLDMYILPAMAKCFLFAIGHHIFPAMAKYFLFAIGHHIIFPAMAKYFLFAHWA